jgi:hypothetical protein
LQISASPTSLFNDFQSAWLLSTSFLQERRWKDMRVGFIALATLATVLVIAPATMAFSGGGGRRGGGGDFSASFVNGGQAGGAKGGSSTAAGNAAGASNGVTASEPLAALAVGLGLLGARYLRRR